MERQYPFPSRTRKSSSLTPMILTLVGNVGCCRTFLFLCNIQKSLRLKEFIRTILTHIKKAVRNIAFIPNWPRSGAFFVRRKVLLPARKFWCCARLFIPYNRSSPFYKNAAGKPQIFVHRLCRTPFLCENILSSVERRYSRMDGNSIVSF